MAITVNEKHNSRSSNGIPGDQDRNATAVFVATGGADQSAVIAAVFAAAPASLDFDTDTLYKSGVRADCETSDTVNDKGVWMCTVTYRTAEWINNRNTFFYQARKPAPPTERSSGSIGTQTINMKRALSNIQHLHGYGSTIDAYDPKELGLHIDNTSGKVKSTLGVDVLVPTQEEAVTATYTSSQWATQKPLVKAVQLCVNDAAWGGFAAGEVLFVGADYDVNHVYDESENDWDEKVIVTYRYIIKPNGVPFPGNSPAGAAWPTKSGHDVIQFYPKVKVSSANTARHDVAMYQRLYEHKSFSVLPTP